MEHLHATHLPLYHKYILMAESSNQPPIKASDSQAIYSTKLQHNILLTKQNLGWFPLNHRSLKIQLFHKSVSFPRPVGMIGPATLLAILAHESKPLKNSTSIASKQFCSSL